MDIRDVKDFMVNLNEEAELKHQLDEISKTKLFNYTDAAGNDAVQTGMAGRYARMNGEHDKYKKYNSKERKRMKGILAADRKLFGHAKVNATESVNQLDEISKELINNYVKKAKIDLKNTEKEERPLNIKRDKYTSAHYSMRAANNEASRAMSSRDWNRALVKYRKAKKTADSIYTPNDAERHNILKDKIDKRKTGLSLAKSHLNSVKEDVDRLNEGWIDHDETHMTNSAGTHHQFKTLLNYKSKNNYDDWKNPQKMNKEDRGSTHYIGSSDGDITKFDKLLGQAKRHKIRIYNRVVPSVGKEGKAHYDHSKYYSNLKEDVDQLGSSVKENFEFKDLISLTESYRSIFK